jgi:hypothetical protein
MSLRKTIPLSQSASTGPRRNDSLGCDVMAIAPPRAPVEHWDDVPSPSTQLVRARDVIYGYVEQLVRDLQTVAD